MWKIKNIEINSPLVLAPMAGYTDLPFRKVYKEFKVGLVYTEMISAMAIHYNSSRTFKMLDIAENEHPIAVQIFGGELNSLLETAKYLDNNSSCDIIDINMGCPVPKVLASDSGSKWLLDPIKAYNMVKQIVESVKKPVTCKMRLGWDLKTQNYLEYAKLMEKAGISAIAVHGRTRSQYYAGEVNYQAIKEIKASLNIPVIANGNINSLKQALYVLNETKADAIMLGRGILGNPYLLLEIDASLNNKKFEYPPLKDKLLVFIKLANYAVAYYKDEEFAIKQLRGQAIFFIKGLPFANEYKNKLTQIISIKELENIFKELLERLTD
ncbi:MAG: tRNA dihydrouridine synthase DusB [Bacillales bacterium]|jgi:nifR3 family TIM-barrel protein|nr:tRNA dihydrouridine synthase DusB [Bacillales bacterium]